MLSEDKKIQLIAKKWNDLIEKELDQKIDASDLSALSSWIIDCYESYKEIYGSCLETFQNASPDDHSLIHDCVVDIYWQLDHIKNHIKASEKGFSSLMQRLARED